MDLEPFVALNQHLVRNLRALGGTEPLSLVASSTRMTIHGHHPAEVGIPSQCSPSFTHTIVSPDTVRFTAEAAPAKACICDPAGITAPASSGLT